MGISKPPSDWEQQLVKLEKERDAAEKERVRLANEVAALKADLTSLKDERDKLNVEFKALRDERASLAKKLSDLLAERERVQDSMTVDEVSEVDLIQVSELVRESLSRAATPVRAGIVANDEGPQYVITEFDIEYKAGIRVDKDGGIKLVSPKSEELGPDSLSTVRMSLRPAANIRIVDSD